MTRDALDYIARTLIFDTVIKHPDRAEATRVANFPFAAIEEAVVNAVYHRGYDTREPIEVRIETSNCAAGRRGPGVTATGALASF